MFDHVFVPAERVFLAGESAQAGTLAETLSIWEHARAVADQADRAELILGLAQTISEMNGILDVTHVRDKLAAIAVWAKMSPRRLGSRAGERPRDPRRDGGVPTTRTCTRRSPTADSCTAR